jgi:helix-turn-helix protein
LILRHKSAVLLLRDCIYTHIYIHTYIHTHIYTHREKHTLRSLLSPTTTEEGKTRSDLTEKEKQPQVIILAECDHTSVSNLLKQSIELINDYSKMISMA